MNFEPDWLRKIVASAERQVARKEAARADSYERCNSSPPRVGPRAKEIDMDAHNQRRQEPEDASARSGESAYQLLVSRVKEFGDRTERLEALANRIVGESPTAIPQRNDTVARERPPVSDNSPLVIRLDYVHEAFSNLCVRQHDALERLERFA